MKTIKLKSLIGIAACAAFLSCNKNAVNSSSEQALAKTAGTSNMQSAFVVNNTYYVSVAIGSDAYTGTSATVGGTSGGKTIGPFKTIQHAADLTVSNDVVNIIADGEYNSTNNPATGYALLNIENDGTTGPITYQGYNGKPVIHIAQTDGYFTAAVLINASNIVFKNVTLSGDALNITGSTNGSKAPKYTVNGITIGGVSTIKDANGNQKYPDGVTVANCTIINFPGGGVGANQSDDIKIQGNEIYGCCKFSGYETSGISVLDPRNITANGDKFNPKIRINTNICHDNKNVTPNYNNPSVITDGNGIIVDVNTAAGGNPNGDYNGFTYVENNICYNNGGAGIQLTKARHVYVHDNTLYHNVQFLTGGDEMGSVGSSDLFYTNNIVVAKNSTTHFNSTFSAGTPAPVYDYNLYYNGTTTNNLNTADAHAVKASPGFAGTPPPYGTIVTNANAFMLATGSAAINQGVKTGIYYYSTRDYANLNRPDVTSGLVDLGAFEKQ